MKVSRKKLINYVRTSIDEVKANGLQTKAERNYVKDNEKFLDTFESRPGTVQEVFDDSLDRFTTGEKIATGIGVAAVALSGPAALAILGGSVSTLGAIAAVSTPLLATVGWAVSMVANDQHFAGKLGAFHDDISERMTPGIHSGEMKLAGKSELYKNRMDAKFQKMMERYEASGVKS